MGLKLEIDSGNENLNLERLEIINEEDSLNKFKIKGLIVGNYKLVA